jgi:excisionase family DNA binding protein
MNLTPKETAERLRTSVGTLSNWRVQGAGPRFIKLGRKVLYPEAEVMAYEQRQLRSNTAQQVA